MTTEHTYTVRWIDQNATEHSRAVLATSPDEAMTMIERTGADYVEAEVCDEHGDQVAVYDARDWEHEDDEMWTCPECGSEMLAWQRGNHEHA
jgi:hypothetical protein